LRSDAAADDALLAETAVGDYRVGLAAGPPRTQHLPGVGFRTPAPPPKGTSHYLMVVLRDRVGKRHLPRADVRISMLDLPVPIPLVETWGEFLHYGTNFVLPADGSRPLVVQVGPPEVDRLADAARRGVRPVRARFTATLRAGRLEVTAARPAPPEPGQRVGDDVLLARADVGPLVPAGPYLLGMLTGPAVPLWRWRDGELTEEAPPPGAVRLGLVLLEQASGRPVPGARVTAVLTPVDGGGTPVRVPLRPVLGRYDHYTGHTAAPGGPVRVRLEVLRPTFATLEAKAFDGRVALELPDSVRPQASAADRPDASSKRP